MSYCAEMSSSQKLNPSELKSQLYHSLQQKGVLDAMKVSIVTHIVKVGAKFKITGGTLLFSKMWYGYYIVAITEQTG